MVSPLMFMASSHPSPLVSSSNLNRPGIAFGSVIFNFFIISLHKGAPNGFVSLDPGFAGALAAGSGVLGASLGAEAVAISVLQPANEKTATAAIKAVIPFLAIPSVLFLSLFILALFITLALLICLLLNA